MPTAQPPGHCRAPARAGRRVGGAHAVLPVGPWPYLVTSVPGGAGWRLGRFRVTLRLKKPLGQAAPPAKDELAGLSPPPNLPPTSGSPRWSGFSRRPPGMWRGRGLPGSWGWAPGISAPSEGNLGGLPQPRAVPKPGQDEGAWEPGPSSPSRARAPGPAAADSRLPRPAVGPSRPRVADPSCAASELAAPPPPGAQPSIVQTLLRPPRVPLRPLLRPTRGAGLRGARGLLVAGGTCPWDFPAPTA